MNLPQLVRAKREERGWSRLELAKRAGVTGPVIGRLEEGEITGRAETIARISEALGLSPIEVHHCLLGLDNRPVPEPIPLKKELGMEEFARRLEILERLMRPSKNDEASVRRRVTALPVAAFVTA